MGNWNYRVFKNGTGQKVKFKIHEVFYKDGKIRGWTSCPISPVANSKSELKLKITEKIPKASEIVEEGDFFSERSQLEAWLKAFEKPILIDED